MAAMGQREMRGAVGDRKGGSPDEIHRIGDRHHRGGVEHVAELLRVGQRALAVLRNGGGYAEEIERAAHNSCGARDTRPLPDIGVSLS
jgi:hypothetical protein